MRYDGFGRLVPTNSPPVAADQALSSNLTCTVPRLSSVVFQDTVTVKR